MGLRKLGLEVLRGLCGKLDRVLSSKQVPIHPPRASFVGGGLYELLPRRTRVLLKSDFVKSRKRSYPRVYLVEETISPKSSAKYGRSSRRNLASMTRDSLVWYALNSDPRSSASRVIRRADRLCVL